MRTISRAMLLMAGIMFVLMGCSDQLSSPSTRSLEGSAPALAKKPIHSAAGSAQMFIWEGPNSVELPLRTHFNFNAKELQDGCYSGTVKVQEPNGAEVAHATVVNLKVDGNKAKLEYLFISGEARYVGRYAFTVVIDNGEGANSGVPDKITITAIYEDEPFPTLEDWRAMSPDEFIAFIQTAQPFIPVYVVQDVDGGIIQVR